MQHLKLLFDHEHISAPAGEKELLLNNNNKKCTKKAIYGVFYLHLNGCSYSGMVLARVV